MSTKPRYKRALTLDELRAMPDEDIDYSDIPKLDGSFWKNAVLIRPEKDLVSIRLDRDVLKFFRDFGPGYQTRINNVLRMYVVRARIDERKGTASKARGVAETGEKFAAKETRHRKAAAKRKT